MSTSATGIVVAKDDGKPIVGLVGLKVRLEDVTQIQHELILDTVVTDGDGKFTLNYRALPEADDNTPGKQPRGLKLSVLLGQLSLYTVEQKDTPNQESVVFPTITLAREEAVSRLATLGSGKASRTTSGNALLWLVDNVDAWRQTAQVINNAAEMNASPTNPDGTLARTVDVMQLDIDANTFKGPHDEDLLKETPSVVLDFVINESFPPDGPATPSNSYVDPTVSMSSLDDRIERMLFDSASSGIDVRLQLPTMTIDKGLKTYLLGAGSLVLVCAQIFIAFSVFLIILAALLYFVFAIIPDFFKAFYRSVVKDDPIEKWFADAASSVAKGKHVVVKELSHRSLNITHAKAVIAGGREAVLLGSPFKQVYYDSYKHLLNEKRRGAGQSKGPIHDVSVGLRGPAVGDLQALFNTHWNIADPEDLREVPPQLVAPDEVKIQPGEFLATVQIALTLDKMFTKAPQDGEKGIQEAYLRAIHFAKDFIYIENQYFYNRLVVQALIDALKANKKLVLILLLNPSPDMPYYLRWQQSALKSITDSLTDPNDPFAVGKQLGVFSSWSFAAADANKKPRLVENYLHTKSAIIDNKWATVGSANLDGASMDAEDYFKSAVDGEVRHTEANVVIQEEDTVQTSAVDALRRRLWAEHLGFQDPDGTLLGDDPQLKATPSGDGSRWLDMWQTKAKARLAFLGEVANKAKLVHNEAELVHILPWPSVTSAPGLWTNIHRAFKVDHYSAKDYLTHLFSEAGHGSALQVSQFDLDNLKGAPFKYAAASKS